MFHTVVSTGEEEEDTIFQVRGKLYGLSEQNAWKERGTGLLKLNVRKSDGRGARLGKSSLSSFSCEVESFLKLKCVFFE